MILQTILILLAISLSSCAALSSLCNGFSFGFQIGGAPPTHIEAIEWRQEHQPVLINGSPVPNKDYPAVVQIFMGSSSCTGTIVGPRVLLTAAHCSPTGGKATFKTWDGKSYSAVMTNGTGYPQQDLDLNLGIINQVVSVPPASVRVDKFERQGMAVDMIGYGCVNPGGGGGNDGVLRKGTSVVSAGQGFDLVLNAPNGAALCFGDSGGPLLYQGKVIGVNSKGNIKDTSYCTRTTLPDAAAFIAGWAKDNAVQICGVNMDCGGGVVPPPQPGPKTFNFEDTNVKISGQCK